MASFISSSTSRMRLYLSLVQEQASYFLQSECIQRVRSGKSALVLYDANLVISVPGRLILSVYLLKIA